MEKQHLGDVCQKVQGTYPVYKFAAQSGETNNLIQEPEIVLPVPATRAKSNGACFVGCFAFTQAPTAYESSANPASVKQRDADQNSFMQLPECELLVRFHS